MRSPRRRTRARRFRSTCEALRAAWLPAVQRVGRYLGAASRPGEADDRRSLYAGNRHERLHQSADAQRCAGLGPALVRAALSTTRTSGATTPPYAREDEANYLAIVTCLRSHDPAMQYAGWFELFLYLPQKRHYAQARVRAARLARFCRDAQARRAAHQRACSRTGPGAPIMSYLKTQPDRFGHRQLRRSDAPDARRSARSDGLPSSK